MGAIYYLSIEPRKHSKFLLLSVAAGLIAIHLHLIWKSNNTDFLITSLIFWIAACLLVWKRRHALNLETGALSSCLGLLLIVAVLLKSTSPSISFPYVLPLISALGIGLLASGFKGLKQYWRELVILFFLGVPHVTLFWLIDISELTAKFVAFVLWYSGFEVWRHGFSVALPTGGIEVYPGCSGMLNVLDQLRLAVLLLVMFPTKWSKKILVPFVAVLIGFVVNGFRVVLMTLLAASSNQKGFEYWHVGDGSLIFSTISVLILCLFCFVLLRLGEPETQNSV